ncbi:MAG TPA: SDR family NAD(P)-dependent oxidoreductase [Thermoanaerobaculia bacterium]|nr:SDR family NAD(P)-dependent oxidoreductase [Thermoanaerobaculia bacterium]HQR66359.1 SDR family NAD(P)-dependent oxidoreductase [Thermoanaerobaculia bacterium]
MKRVVVVGATDGLGKALAAEYASRGAWVCLVGRGREKLEAVRAEIAGRFPDATVTAVVCDLREAARIAPAFREAVASIGHCDLFLYNAGVMYPGDGLTADGATDRETMEVNAVAGVEMLGLAANYFREARRGQIAAISSIAGDRGRKGNPAYNASKAALTTYLEGLRNRLHPFGVTVSTVKPGFVGTKMTAGKPGLFWVVPPDEAARIIADRLERRHEVFYVYRRWGLLGLALRHVPRFLFKRFGPP